MDDWTVMAVATEELAAGIATEVTGQTPVRTRRFTTGARHYVFEVEFAKKPDDQIFRLYVSLFLLDLMAEHGQVFNGNECPSIPEARASLRQAFQNNLRLAMA
jgi:hypothetical protein